MTEKKVTLKFTKEKETKGTFRYSEDGDDPKVGSLYIKKSACGDLGNPESLTVVITAGS